MSGGHAYEVSLSGEFFPKDLKPILNRITLHAESSSRIHTREIVFRPFNNDMGLKHSGTEIEPPLLRARKETLDEHSAWELYTYLKAESASRNPEATVRACAVVYINGDALSFAAGLGYVKQAQIYKRGYAFRRGPLLILIFQQENTDPHTELPIPAHADTLWEVEVKTAQPIRDSPSKAIEVLLEFQGLMKGLLDLRRQEM